MWYIDGISMVQKAKDTSQIHIRLSYWMGNGVEVLAAKLGMTVSDVIRMAVNEFLKKELDNTELALLKNENTCTQLVQLYSSKQQLGASPNIDKKSTSEHAFKQGESEEDKKMKIKEFIEHIVVDEYMDDWLYDSIAAKEKQIRILKQNLLDAQNAGNTSEVATIKEEIQRIENILINLKRSGSKVIDSHIGGKLRLRPSHEQQKRHAQEKKPKQSELLNHRKKPVKIKN